MVVLDDAYERRGILHTNTMASRVTWIPRASSFLATYSLHDLFTSNSCAGRTGGTMVQPFGMSSQQSAAPPDAKLPGAPADSISSIAFCPSDTLNLIAAGSWDGTVRLWNISEQPGGMIAGGGSNIMGTGVGEIRHTQPVLSVAMADNGTVFSGGCDGKGMMWTPSQGGGPQQPRQIAEHGQPIRSIMCVQTINLVATGSWDNTVKFWDTRQQAPVQTINLPSKVLAMDCRFPYLVVATAAKEQGVHVYNLQGGPKPFKPNQPMITSQIKQWQTRSVCMFPDCSGFALGNIEGRVAIHYIDNRQGDKTVEFAYKCHRVDPKDSPDKQTHIYAVNSISFHQRFGTFATAGSDGTYAFWDKDKRQRLKPPTKLPAPIVDAKFNQRGDLYAYAVSYDWSKGSEHYNKAMPNEIYLHVVKEDEVKPKKK